MSQKVPRELWYGEAIRVYGLRENDSIFLPCMFLIAQFTYHREIKSMSEHI